MAGLNYLKKPDINEGVQRFRSSEGAVLLDVRSRQEYAAGHIPGSINLPLHRLAVDLDELPGNAPLYVHCLSGGRSKQAVSFLKEMGYNEVYDIGGISSYQGKLEV